MVARRIVTVALVLLPVLAAGVSTRIVFRDTVPAYVDFERNYEGAFISGFYGHEKMDGRGFRWTAREAFVHFENLPRRSRLRVEVRLKGLRPRGDEAPHVRFTANGASVFETVCAPGLVTYRFGVTSPDSTLRLGIHPDIFVPADMGRDDDRVLGVQVYSVLVEPQEGETDATGPALWMMLAATVLLGVGLSAGLTVVWSSLFASVFIAGFIVALGQESVRFLPYAQNVVLLAALTLIVCWALRGLLGWAGWPHPEERAVLVAVAAGSFLLKIGVLFYPLFVSSDADFQANRLLDVLEGDFFTTSVTQHDPPFRIPYPVSLYVLAAPWAAAGLDRVDVLKALTALFDVGIGLVLAYLARRFLGDLRSGILAAVLYQLVPINFLAFSAGNFTNLFGVAATTIFIGFLLAAYSGGKKISAVGVFVFSLLALTAHFGTFLYGMLLWPALLVAVFLLAPQELTSSRQRKLIVGLVVGSVVVSLLYYAGYWELFTGQWDRVLTRDYATGGAAVDGPLQKLVFNLHFYREQVGIVFCVLAFLGALGLLLRPTHSVFHAAVAAWAGVTAIFFVLDLMTALEVRYLLQVLPLLALFAGRYLSGSFARGGSGGWAALVILFYLVVEGLSNVFDCMINRYH
jgi:hypothetical protein